MKRGFAVWGKKPLKLIRLDYKETKEYNYHCNFEKHFNHLTFEVINYSQRGCRLFGANLKKILQKTYLIFFISLSLIFSACASSVQVQTKEVLIPIKCNLEMPKKPKENGSFESHKALGIYFLEVERTLKDCLSVEWRVSILCY